MKRLPDAEFEVMKAIWAMEPPTGAGAVLAALPHDKEWKVQTVISLLGRLVERAYLSTEKKGKERTYTPLITREAYLSFETEHFIRQYHENSFTSLMSALTGGKPLSQEDAKALAMWLDERRP